MAEKILSISIDGPAGVGKSTVSKLVAKKLGWNCLDTGALYRAITVECLRRKIDISNPNQIKEILKVINISIDYKNGVQQTLLNEKNVNDQIRSPAVDKAVAYVAKIKEVREKVLEVQRQIACNQNVVIEGRDIGNNVIPETINKFFLIADAEERANRRFKERVAKGEKPNFEEILEDVKLRDKMDMEREISPLKPAPDAKIIDTTKLNIEEVVEAIVQKIELEKTPILEK